MPHLRLHNVSYVGATMEKLVSYEVLPLPPKYEWYFDFPSPKEIFGKCFNILLNIIWHIKVPEWDLCSQSKISLHAFE